MVDVLDVEYVRYAQRDLDAAERFLLDFGLITLKRDADRLVMRGAAGRSYCYVGERSDEPGLRGIALRVGSLDALDEAACWPEASSVEALSAPGGGFGVRMVSPEGIPFELVYGIAATEPVAIRPALVINSGDDKPRTGTFQRPAYEPAAVTRLGHVALLTTDFSASADWLARRFGLAPSDLLFDGSPENVLGGFFHCSGADGWTDHHSIALFPGNKAGVHHSSFEVQDVDAQFLGNRFLIERGHRPLWGVGRHILGSQIFDYWFDPDGNVVEHFTDTDVVRPPVKPGYHQVADDSLAQWGPPISVGDFIDMRAPGA